MLSSALLSALARVLRSGLYGPASRRDHSPAPAGRAVPRHFYPPSIAPAEPTPSALPLWGRLVGADSVARVMHDGRQVRRVGGREGADWVGSSGRHRRGWLPPPTAEGRLIRDGQAHAAARHRAGEGLGDAGRLGDGLGRCCASWAANGPAAGARSNASARCAARRSWAWPRGGTARQRVGRAPTALATRSPTRGVRKPPPD